MYTRSSLEKIFNWEVYLYGGDSDFFYDRRGDLKPIGADQPIFPSEPRGEIYSVMECDENGRIIVREPTDEERRRGG